MYTVKFYENLEKFNIEQPELVKRLLEVIDIASWKGESICFYTSLEEFAKSEIYDGYYSECIDEDYRYLPKFTQYINFKELGKDLKLILKDSRYKNDYYFDEKTGSVITTKFGRSVFEWF